MEAKVGIYMCPLKIKIIAIDFYRLIIDKILNGFITVGFNIKYFIKYCFFFNYIFLLN